MDVVGNSGGGVGTSFDLPLCELAMERDLKLVGGEWAGGVGGLGVEGPGVEDDDDDETEFSGDKDGFVGRGSLGLIPAGAAASLNEILDSAFAPSNILNSLVLLLPITER